jgi:quinol monooxygenase YgiN
MSCADRAAAMLAEEARIASGHTRAEEQHVILRLLLTPDKIGTTTRAHGCQVDTDTDDAAVVGVHARVVALLRELRRAAFDRCGRWHRDCRSFEILDPLSYTFAHAQRRRQRAHDAGESNDDAVAAAADVDVAVIEASDIDDGVDYAAALSGDGGELVVTQRWLHRAALDDFHASQAFSDVTAQFKGLLRAPPQTSFLTATHTPAALSSATAPQADSFLS